MKVVTIHTIRERASGALPLMPLLIIFCLTCSGKQLFAADLLAAEQLALKTADIGVEAQQDHETWVDEEGRLVKEIEGLQQKVEHVRWQRHKLAVYRGGIVRKITELEKKAEAMEAVNQELLPLLEDNLERLNQELASDLPCNLPVRRKSLINSQNVLNDYDMGLLDKTRAVLDAIAHEVDLGHHVSVWEDEIDMDGTTRRVKMLQVGRVGLYAITLDGEKAFVWERSDSHWQTREQNAKDIREAMEMAEGIRLVGLSNLPVSPAVQRASLEERN